MLKWSLDRLLEQENKCVYVVQMNRRPTTTTYWHAHKLSSLFHELSIWFMAVRRSFFYWFVTLPESFHLFDRLPVCSFRASSNFRRSPSVGRSKSRAFSAIANLFLGLSFSSSSSSSVSHTWRFCSYWLLCACVCVRCFSSSIASTTDTRVFRLPWLLRHACHSFCSFYWLDSLSLWSKIYLIPQIWLFII